MFTKFTNWVTNKFNKSNNIEVSEPIEVAPTYRLEVGFTSNCNIKTATISGMSVADVARFQKAIADMARYELAGDVNGKNVYFITDSGSVLFIRSEYLANYMILEEE